MTNGSISGGSFSSVTDGAHPVPHVGRGREFPGIVGFRDRARDSNKPGPCNC